MMQPSGLAIIFIVAANCEAVGDNVVYVAKALIAPLAPLVPIAPSVPLVLNQLSPLL